MGNIFEDISDGLINLDPEITTEAVTPDMIPELKVFLKQVYLPAGHPTGRGNLAYLYAHNIDQSIALMTNQVNFLHKNKYNTYYYNRFYQGRIYNKKYRFNDLDLRTEVYDKVKESIPNMNTRVKIVSNPKENRNMFYDLHRYINIFESICVKLQPLKYVSYYWEYFKQIFNLDLPGYTNRFVLVNLKDFPLPNTGKYIDNMKNPLYVIFYTIWKNPDALKDIDIDFFFMNEKRCMKVNPSHLVENPKESYKNIRITMNILMKGISSEAIIDKALNEENIKKEELVSSVVDNVIAKDFDDPKKDTIITTSDQLNSVKNTSHLEDSVRAQAVNAVNNLPPEIKITGTPKLNKVAAVGKEKPNPEEKTVDDMTDNFKDVSKLSNEVRKTMDSDRKAIEEIYYSNKRNSVPEKSSFSTARDELLRKNQENLKVKGMTIADLKKIDTYSVQIPTVDIGKGMKTTNENMKQFRFPNFNKTYIEKIMPKDITNAILSLNDKSIPIFIRDIKVEDTSDELNYKETYTILMEDQNRQRHTVKVDIPKFIDGKFLFIGGNKKLIKYQDFYYPVVKISPTMVQIVTNYSKMTLHRVENTSISPVERMKKLVMDNDDMKKLFKLGSSFISNKSYVTTIEYDDYSRNFSEFRKDDKNVIFFDSDYAHTYAGDNKIALEEGELFLGLIDGSPVYIDYETQTDKYGNTITDLIYNQLPSILREEYDKMKAPKRLMFSKVKIMKQFVNVGMLLGLWEGLSELLKKMNCTFRLENSIPKVLSPSEDYIKFADTVLVYNATVANSLILNGIKQFDTNKYNLADFDTKDPYIKYIAKVYGNVIIENALMNFYEFAIDPITMEILEKLNYPTDIVNLFIYAVNLLADSQFENEISQNLYRVRCAEIIPAILYEKLAKNYVSFRNFGGRKKFSIPQDAVIKEILAQKTVEDYSTLNPSLELQMTHSISTKGFRGINLDDSYTMEKRGYDPSMIGIMAPSTSPDGNCGVMRTLTMEPNIVNLRGFTKNEPNMDNLKDVNLFSPTELSMPFAASNDDPNRLG